MSTNADTEIKGPTLLGHPTALFVLFFAEMWERFSYYGMRALLVYYMIKGFLGYSDGEAYAIYGSYGALVYATPFVGGMLADRLLGARKAVILGGILMAAGHLLMTVEQSTAFFLALALLVVGNGFFKPNISTIVGRLYPQGSPKKDSGFTLFYMGINLGAAMSGIVCGYVGETFGWHYGFGLATFGMLIGLAVFWAPKLITQVLIGGGAVAMAIGMMMVASNPLLMAVNGFLALALLGTAALSVTALQRGGLPAEAGAVPDMERLKRPVFAGISTEWVVYLSLLIVVPVISLFLKQEAIVGVILLVVGAIALLVILKEAFGSAKVARERMFVMLVLMFFSMLFWAFFEQAGSSINNFTDRNVDRVQESYVVDESMVGDEIEVALTQEQVGFPWSGPELSTLIIEGEGVSANEMLPEGIFTISALDAVRNRSQEEAKAAGEVPSDVVVSWTLAEAHVGMGVAESADSELRASVFQSANPVYILLFGLVFSWLWAYLGRKNLDPSTPVKFALGLAQLGLGFLALYIGATQPDGRGMVSLSWLLLGYLLHTTGELCLSPVGLSMVTKLSPKHLVSTIMGAWFLATAFSGFLAGQIAKLTGVGGEGGESGVIPPPMESLGIYSEVFQAIAWLSIGSAVLVLVLSPILTRWMHMSESELAAE